MAEKPNRHQPTAPSMSGNGMTVRDAFAMSAMQGFLSSCAGDSANPAPEVIARMAVQIADKTLDALGYA